MGTHTLCLRLLRRTLSSILMLLYRNIPPHFMYIDEVPSRVDSIQLRYREFVAGLGLSADAEKRLSELTPSTYIGIAPELLKFAQ